MKKKFVSILLILTLVLITSTVLFADNIGDPEPPAHIHNYLPHDRVLPCGCVEIYYTCVCEDGYQGATDTSKCMFH